MMKYKFYNEGLINQMNKSIIQMTNSIDKNNLYIKELKWISNNNILIPDLWKIRKPAAAPTVIKSTYPCLPSQCTCEPITKDVNVPTVESAFPGLGFCRVTFERIQVCFLLSI